MPTAILALVVAVLSGLAVDGVRAAQATASADAIAAEAARAGGQAVDTAALARGNPQIDPAAAVAAARSYLTAAAADGTAVVRGSDDHGVGHPHPADRAARPGRTGDDHQPRCRPRTTRPGRCAMRSAMRATVRATASLAGIVAILVGVPILLWQLGTPLLPSRVPSLHEALAVFLRPDDGSLLMGTLLVIGVLVWAQLMSCRSSPNWLRRCATARDCGSSCPGWGRAGCSRPSSSPVCSGRAAPGLRWRPSRSPPSWPPTTAP